MEKIIILYLTFLISACSITFPIPHKAWDNSIDNLDSYGFSYLGKDKTTDMQKLYMPMQYQNTEKSKVKTNVCGLQAGISTGALFDDKEIFYDDTNTSIMLNPLGGKDYIKLTNSYPIMRSGLYDNGGVGVFPLSLANFWTSKFKNYKASAHALDNLEEMISVIKKEITINKMPVMLNVKIIGDALPIIMPDNNLGLRVFLSTHWIVVLGFNEKTQEWLIRDNGGLEGVVKYENAERLISISDKGLKYIANVGELSDDVKSYVNDRNLPIYLDDATSNDPEAEIKKDFIFLKKYNFITFSRK